MTANMQSLRELRVFLRSLKMNFLAKSLRELRVCAFACGSNSVCAGSDVRMEHLKCQICVSHKTKMANVGVERE